jgi:hypothetical protein
MEQSTGGSGGESLPSHFRRWWTWLAYLRRPAGLLLCLWLVGLGLFLIVWPAPPYALFWTAVNLLLAILLVREPRRSVQPVPIPDPDPPQPSPAPGDSYDELVPLVHEALQRMNKATLASCRLADRLPLTIAATFSRWDDEQVTAGSLAQARALKEILISAIERLKLDVHESTGNGAPDPIEYTILHEQFVLGRQAKFVMHVHDITSKTFFRRQGGAIKAITHELCQQEEQLVGSRNGHGRA